MNAVVEFRAATRFDLEAIVKLLADDPLGAQRERTEDSLATEYVRAFKAIDTDPNQVLLVGTSEDRVVAVLQLTLIPGLSRGGALRAQIEGVRVAAEYRSSGLGALLIENAVDRARARGARLVQLTTDKTRADALRFYERLGFEASHEGMKLDLDPDPDLDE